MTARLGPAALISPQQAEDRLSGPVLYLLAGFVRAVFPQSSNSAPSPFVYIQPVRNAPWSLEIAPRFPVSINSKQWHLAVVPVLEDPRWQFNSTMIKRSLESGNQREVLQQVGAALRQSFEAAGYGPPT